MPETTVHEYDLSAGWKGDIRLSRKLSVMQAIAIAQAMKEFSDDFLGLGIYAADAGHKCTTHLR